jgi:hypothetical protein
MSTTIDTIIDIGEIFAVPAKKAKGDAPRFLKKGNV